MLVALVAAMACSTTLEISGTYVADDGEGGADGGEGGVPANEAGAEAGAGDSEAGTSPRCTPPCTAIPTGVQNLTGVRGIVATSNAIVTAHAGGLTWCNDPACGTSSTMSLTGAGAAAIARVPGTETVLAVSSGNRLFGCTGSLAMCAERYQATDFIGIGAFAASATQIFWMDATYRLLSAPQGAAATTEWLLAGEADRELAGAPFDTVVLASPAESYVVHVTSAAPALSTVIASPRDVLGPRGVALAQGSVFIASRGNGQIVRCPLAGCTDAADASVGSTIATNQAGPLYLATDATHVYWTNEGGGLADGTVTRAPLTGGAVEVVITGLVKPRYIAVSAAAIWVTIGQPGGPTGLMYVLKN
jgi:hypothetical protein